LVLLPGCAAPLSVAYLPAAEPDQVDRYRCSAQHTATWGSERDIELAYASRSVSILEAAMRGDSERLSAQVAPDATFEIWEADSGFMPRTQNAAAAASEFARRLGARRFQFLARYSVLARDPCGPVSVELLLEGLDAEQSAKVTFAYRRGMLVSASGNVGVLASGELRPAGPSSDRD
jgi:hypothetical protein